ncbi:unnamed protein product [Pieris brassicae]|uniref:Uncharacterized protein n=1 Tax=Pieris brassicae TaxID=7116 RepID=A0A9P0XJF3_PIEBR|nr:unnamed protein product [Pieris brassicae]
MVPTQTHPCIYTPFVQSFVLVCQPTTLRKSKQFQSVDISTSKVRVVPVFSIYCVVSCWDYNYFYWT